MPHPELAPPLHVRLFPNKEWVLLLVLIVECTVFATVGHNFWTAGNAFEVTRLAALRVDAAKHLEVGVEHLTRSGLDVAPIAVAVRRAIHRTGARCEEHSRCAA